MKKPHDSSYTKIVMELEQDPSLSGAYIRSLVKQLTTTRKPKETMKTKHHEHIKVQPQHHKKQVRRRLHTSRPYQEKLLNMAEARKEIVTALKFHRASMKQASEKEQQQKKQESLLVVSHSSQQLSHVTSFDFEQDLRFKSRRNPRIYPSCTNNFSNEFCYSSFFNSPLSLPIHNSHTWPISSSFSPTLLVENSHFTLPNQSLGLNLSLHDFNNLDATLLLNNNNNNNSSLCSYSSPTSSSPPLSLANDHEVPSNGISQGEGVSLEVDTIESSDAITKVNEGGSQSHAAIDDESMEEMRSLGEQYQMEWNDTMNLVTSTLWFNFLKKMEHDDDDACNHVFDEFMEFPAWLNAQEERCLEEWSEDYFLDLNLPW
jgi:hypothetical protein